MTKVVGSNAPLANVARAMNGYGHALQALGAQQTQYVLNAQGNCVAIIGDISHAPVNAYTASPSMVPTGLTGWGIASKSSGTWVQL